MLLPGGEIFEDASSEERRLDILLRWAVPDEGDDPRLLPRDLLELPDHLLEFRRRGGTGCRQSLTGEFAHPVWDGRQGRHRGHPLVSGRHAGQAQDALIYAEASLVRAHVDR